MSNIVSDNSHTIFSALLEDIKNLRVFFNNANNSEKTMEDYTEDSNIEIASTARELQKSLDDIEKGKHMQFSTHNISKKQASPTHTKSRTKKIVSEEISKVENLKIKKVTNNEHDLEDR